MSRIGYGPARVPLPEDVITRYRALGAGEDLEFTLPKDLEHLRELDIAMALKEASRASGLPSVLKGNGTYYVIKPRRDH